MGDLIDPQHQSRDIRLIASAIRKGWNIPPDIMESLPATIAELMETGDDRTKIAAAKVLLAMHGQNQRDKPAVKRVRHLHQLGTLPPVNGANLEERKAFLASRIIELGDDSGASGGHSAPA